MAEYDLSRSRKFSKRRLLIARQQVCWIAVDLDAAGIAQIAFGKATAKHAQGAHMQLGCCQGIVGRVADHDGFVRVNMKPVKGRLDNVRMRFRLIGVVGRGFFVDEILDLGDLFQPLEFVFLRRGSQSDLAAILQNTLEELTNFWEWANLIEILVLEELRTVRGKLFADAL